MNINEDRISEIICELEQRGSSVDMATVRTLKKLVEPKQLEIPEGCPVIAWNDGDEHKKIRTTLYNTGSDCGEVYYRCGSAGDYEAFDTIEIDYQRKGHVIPWHGNTPFPIDGAGAGIAYYKNGASAWFNDATTLKGWVHSGARDRDIIAYVIWPEWVKS